MAATTPQKFNSEHSAATFSYAQAAKGRSPSVPDTAAEVEKPLTKRTSSEGHIPSGEALKAKSESEMTSPEKPETNKSSTPSSPDFGTASTSTLLKDDDPFSSQNGSSESTWDKQSDSSRSGNRSISKADADKPSEETLSWSDDTPAPLALKDAPVPTVNCWQQRSKEAQEAKARANKPVGAPLNKAADASSTNLTAVPRVVGEANQRKPKGSSGSQEPNSQSVHTKEGIRNGDGKTRNADDGMLLDQCMYARLT